MEDIRGVTTWRKSSYSGPGGNECVEVGVSDSAAFLVRDTKNRAGGVLAFGPDAWQRFAAKVTDKA
ncbi:MAG TPA: DUF397 domain-containing protein [Pseudonocardiaceae bacterium]